MSAEFSQRLNWKHTHTHIQSFCCQLASLQLTYNILVVWWCHKTWRQTLKASFKNLNRSVVPSASSQRPKAHLLRAYSLWPSAALRHTVGMAEFSINWLTVLNLFQTPSADINLIIVIHNLDHNALVLFVDCSVFFFTACSWEYTILFLNIYFTCVSTDNLLLSPRTLKNQYYKNQKWCYHVIKCLGLSPLLLRNQTYSTDNVKTWKARDIHIVEAKTRQYLGFFISKMTHICVKLSSLKLS